MGTLPLSYGVEEAARLGEDRGRFCAGTPPGVLRDCARGGQETPPRAGRRLGEVERHEFGKTAAARVRGRHEFRKTAAARVRGAA
jgi:hypothetical protein